MRLTPKLRESTGAKPQAARVVRDGRILTGGGVTAGIDFALTLVAELAGTTEAEAIQLALEYAPAPPFDAGRPEQCPPAVLALVKQRGAALRAEREVIVGRVARSHRTAGNSPDSREAPPTTFDVEPTEYGPHTTL